ncbi:MAG: BON domain-containing protein [Chitinivibrionales bacterium]|nr:BON domain-containing protein [Chitinivibrionales bacterium]
MRLNKSLSLLFFSSIGSCRLTLHLTVLIGIITVASAVQAAPQKKEIEDSKITQAIEQALRRDDAVSSHLISVVTTDGIVTLDGSVSNILEKNRAEAMAGTFKGVRSIVNRIDVLPVMRSETQIRTDVLSALAADPATESFEIDVDVDAGTITLKGNVDSYAEKSLASKVIKGVKGVKNIENKIEVAFKDGRSDHEIQEEIERRLEFDPYIPASLITVDVLEGEVTLKGTVGTARVKTLAYNKAWVAGVEDVDHSKLSVDWWAAAELKRKDPTPEVTDSTIKAAVKDALRYDPRTASFNINVKVDNGTVYLNGKVENYEAKRAAEQNARNTVGVNEVDNYLFVKVVSPTDKEVKSEVLAALARDPVLERHEIRPVVRNKKVYLYGEVDSYYEKVHAENVVSRVNGVAAIQNTLNVPKGWTWESDQAIMQNIKDEFFWNGNVDRKDIDVSVEDGIATLKGKVDNWSEYHAAITNAFDAGARTVESELDIAGKNIVDNSTFYFDYYYYNPDMGMY